MVVGEKTVGRKLENFEEKAAPARNTVGLEKVAGARRTVGLGGAVARSDVGVGCVLALEAG